MLDAGSAGLVMSVGGSGLSAFPSLPVVYLACPCVLAGCVEQCQREGVREGVGSGTRRKGDLKGRKEE